MPNYKENSYKLLRKYISAAINESIRSSSFRENELRKLDNLESILDYSSTHLKEMSGEDSSRSTFFLSSKKTLKVALGWHGIAKNEEEVNLYTSPQARKIIARIYDYDKDYKWIISELVKPLEGSYENSFYKKYDVDFSEFIEGLYNSVKENDGGKEHLDSFVEYYNISDEYRDFFLATLSTIEKGTLLIGDIKEPGHWGVTPDGRIVLSDYGFTQNVASMHYTQGKPSTKIAKRK